MNSSELARKIIDCLSDGYGDEEVEIWIPSRGKNGVPSSISTLLHDAEWKLEQLESLLSDLQIVKVA